MKMLMAVSGALFVFYVLAHMYGNLKIFSGVQAFDEYAHHLRTMFTPILPFGGFLWLFRVVLVLALVAHAWAAFYLWSKARGARTTRYVAQGGRAGHGQEQDDALGRRRPVALPRLAPAAVHHRQVQRRPARRRPAARALLVISSFQVWWVVLIYLLALVALGLHLYHGVWSATQTMGWAGSSAARRRAKTTGTVIALVTSVGFALPPLAILFGIVKGS